MKIIKISLKLFLIVAVSSLFFASCDKVDDPTPTHELMQGVWKIEAVYDENDSNITDKVTTMLPAFLQMDDVNSVNSTCGPLFMYIVYGKSKFINILSRVDEVFQYADLSLTEGEWFINKTEVVDKFTVEVKMKFPGMNTLESILSDMGGINLGFIDNMMEAVIYHKFMDVGITASDENPDVMTWTIDASTIAEYNTKDQYGHYVLWSGVGTDSFTKCRIEWTKQVKTITDCVNDSYGGSTK